MMRMLRNVAGVALLASGIMIAQPVQQTFETPEAAVKALIAAVASGNAEDMAAVLGADMKDQFGAGDPKLSSMDRADFLKAAGTATRIENDTVPGRKILYVGANDWPFPAPLVRAENGWRFEGAAGRQEIQDRRVGHNEMHAVEICLGFVEAQVEYARIDHDGNGILEFAQRLISSPGKHDGVYWPDSAAGRSPFGPALNESDSTGPEGAPRTQRHFGYHFRVLTAQGGNALGGARSFLFDGHLLGGFGLLAWPREYGVTGVQTFMVNQLGVVYAKNLGPETATLAPAITVFDPDSTWKRLDPAN